MNYNLFIERSRENKSFEEVKKKEEEEKAIDKIADIQIEEAQFVKHGIK